MKGEIANIIITRVSESKAFYRLTLVNNCSCCAEYQ